MGAAVHAVQHHDGRVDACLAQLERFFGQGHAKAKGAHLLQPARHGHHAVPVGVGLDHRQHAAGARDVARHAQVVHHGVEVDLGARGAQRVRGGLQARLQDQRVAG
jgi:hypothetical protein